MENSAINVVNFLQTSGNVQADIYSNLETETSSTYKQINSEKLNYFSLSLTSVSKLFIFIGNKTIMVTTYTYNKAGYLYKKITIVLEVAKGTEILLKIAKLAYEHREDAIRLYHVFIK